MSHPRLLLNFSPYAVCISHDHYDHLDLPTITHLYNTQKKGTLHFFAPLAVKKWFESCGVAPEHVDEFDWWDSATFKSPALGTSSLRLTYTPCQHGSGRTILGYCTTLWGSWALEYFPTSASDGEKIDPAAKVWFGGDTAYRSVPRGVPPEKELDLPHCPAFKEIGRKFGGFDLAVRGAHTHHLLHLQD